MALRHNRHVRSVGGYQELRTDVPNPTDVKEDRPHQEALVNLVPQIAGRSRNAIKVDRVDLQYYQRKLTGRRCSCFTGGETQADGLCQVCWGTGVVGGFDKYGTRTEIIDVTRPQLQLVNVHPAYELNTRPIFFKLNDNAVSGFVETTVPILYNRGILDYTQLVALLYEGGSTVGLVRMDTEVNFVPITPQNLQARLSASNLVFRLQLFRNDITFKSPLLSHLMFRYNLIQQTILVADQPIVTESIALSEFGIFDQMQVSTFYFNDTFNSFTTQDFMIRLRDLKRFKVIELAKNAPLTLTTTTQITGRLVQPYENYARIP